MKRDLSLRGFTFHPYALLTLIAAETTSVLLRAPIAILISGLAFDIIFIAVFGRRGLRTRSLGLIRRTGIYGLTFLMVFRYAPLTLELTHQSVPLWADNNHWLNEVSASIFVPLLRIILPISSILVLRSTADPDTLMACALNVGVPVTVCYLLSSTTVLIERVGAMPDFAIHAAHLAGKRPRGRVATLVHQFQARINVVYRALVHAGDAGVTMSYRLSQQSRRPVFLIEAHFGAADALLSAVGIIFISISLLSSFHE